MINLSKFSTFVASNDYTLFVESVDAYLINSELIESRIDEGLMDYFKDKLDFIKELASKFLMNVTDLLIAFKDKFIFDIFSKVGWSLKKLALLVRDGYKLYTELHKIIFKYLKEKGITKWTDNVIKELDDYLASHPFIKHASGIVIAGFLIYQWTHLIAFTGDIDFDFDQTTLFQALGGNFSLMDLFGGESGLKLLAYIASNVLGGITFPWTTVTEGSVLFAFSIIYTVAKHKYPVVAKNMHPILSNISKLKHA
jgi:hypothetical protein